MDFSFLKNPKILAAIVFTVIAIIIGVMFFKNSSKKSSFKRTLISPMNEIENNPPKDFTQLSESTIDNISLEEPVVPEEIGLAMVYPQGSGVGMSKNDSNSFEPTNPGPLLTNYTIPESYGESSLADPLGNQGAGQGSRILKIASTGSQLNYKPVDESLPINYAAAYEQGEVQDGRVALINNSQPVNYDEAPYNPDNNLILQTSPGQESTIPNCETTYPNVVKYNDFCITEGDIPYGQVVDGKVNPRLVSRWQSFTGDYSREEALDPIDGVLYPNLAIPVK